MSCHTAEDIAQCEETRLVPFEVALSKPAKLCLDHPAIGPKVVDSTPNLAEANPILEISPLLVKPDLRSKWLKVGRERAQIGRTHPTLSRN